MNKRAATYSRVSTDGQREEKTIESQVAEIKRRVTDDKNVLTAEHTFIDDGWSGELLERPKLDQLRDAAARGEFDILYVYDRGRLARKFAYQELIIEEIRDAGIEFVTLHDIDAATPEERVLQAMQGVFHEYERVKIAERFRRGKIHKVKNGNLLGYNPKFGYSYTPRTKQTNGFFTVKQDSAAVVELVFEWFTLELLSMRAIIKRLYEQKIPSPNEKETWGMGTIGRLLRDETYAGTHYYYKSEAVKPSSPQKSELGVKKYRRTKKTSRRYRPKEEWLAVEVPPIVSRSTFEKAQQLLAENKKFSSRNTKRPYLLQGVVYCPCGQRRNGESSTGGKHSHYRCIDRINKYPLREFCLSGGVNGKVLDSLVWNEIITMLTNPKEIKAQAQSWVTQESIVQPDALAKQRVIKELDQLESEAERFTKAYGAEAMPLDLYKVNMDRITKRRAELKAEEAAAKNPAPLPTMSEEKLLQVADEIIQELDFTDKKAIIRQLVDKVVADQDKVEILGHIPVPSNRYVELSHEDRHCGSAKCW